MQYEQLFIFSMFLTLIVEIPVAILLVRNFYKHKEIKTSKIIFAGIIASALTLPYFWFVLPAFIHTGNAYYILGESVIVIVEAVVYNQLLELKLSKAFAVSLAANIASIVVGLLFR